MDKIEIVPGQTFAGFGFTIALSNLRPRLIKGEQIELKAVGFSPIPTLRGQVVTVKVSHAGLNQMKMSGRTLRGDNFIIHPEIPVLAKLFIISSGYLHLVNESQASRFFTLGRTNCFAERLDDSSRSCFRSCRWPGRAGGRQQSAVDHAGSQIPGVASSIR